jgi:hypothetical protein
MGDGSVKRRISFGLALVFAIAAAGELCAQGFLIPDTTRRGMVFDFAGQNLYFTTSAGLVKTFHLSTLTFGTSYNLGGSLNGIDIARDNSFLLVAQDGIGISQGTFQRVNLASGTITNINYPLEFGEGGAWDVAIGSSRLALVTTQFQGSGYTPLREIDLNSNAIAIRGDAPGVVWAPTQIHRSADGTRLFFMEGNISSAPAFTYSATTNTFGPVVEVEGYLDTASGAVDRGGNLIALRMWATPASLNTAPNFGFVHSFNGLDSGVAFDAIRNVLYGVNSETDEIIAYSTVTFSELFRLFIGENVEPGATQFNTGRLVAGADGRWIALETDSGIRLFQLPNTSIGQPTDFNVDRYPDYLLYNGTTRQTAIWYLNNNVFLNGTYAPNLPAGWSLADVADFNADGHPDYALFNGSTRQTAIWYLSNNIYVSGAYGPTVPAGWQVSVTGDFNLDGRPDYALYNSSTRQTAIWYLNNNVYLSGRYGPTLPVGWSLVGLSDFNGDGKTDYLLFNSVTRQSAIWYLNNNVYVRGAYGPTIPAGYTLAGAADFNLDGKPDYNLFNTSDDRTAIWYLNNNIYVSGVYGPTLRAGWSLAKP